MGALISLALVQEAPERVGRIVLMGPAGAPVKLTPGLRKVITFYDEPTAESMAELLSLFVHDPAVFGDDLHRIAKDRLAQAIRPEVARSHRATFAVGEPFRFSEDDLAKVANQTLVVHGSEDRIIPIDAAHYFAKHLPNADLEIVENAGHWLQIEQASRFEALLRAFLVGAPA
jgi:2-hydroxymuconate-semialdehyde hydrolase